MQALIRPPEYVTEQCAMLGLPTSGNAAGHYDLTDLTGLPLGPHRQVLGLTPKAIAALSGCVVAALSGMTSVGLYAFGFGVKRGVVS
jgi:iron transport multicopper oxidase